MDQFIQYTPTEVVFGKETENQAGAEVKKWGGTKVLVVYGGGSAKRSGLLDRVEASLAKEGLAFEELGGVKPNPRLALAEEGVKKAVEMQADFILAVGGGSSIDTAKAVAHGAANPAEALWDIWTKKVPLTKSLPVGAVLTIPAAGSEMSDSAVLTNEAIGKKAGINTPFNRCKFAIMNPELAATLPKYQIACGVTDIMMHTMERYFIPESQCEMTDEIAEGLLRTVIKNGPKVLEYNARFGDPEAQVVLPRMKNDIIDVVEACIDGTLDQIDLQFEDNAAVCVVLASDGYPVKYDKGLPISGLDEFGKHEGYYCFHAGTKFDGDQIVTNGGRVLGVTAKGKDLKEARANAYTATEWVKFDNKYMRHDIGKAIDEA